MSDEAHTTPSAEKQYWHDRRPVPIRTATSSPGEMAEQLGQRRQLQTVRPAFTAPRRTIPNLRHPITAFVLAVLAVIFIGVGLLAVTGSGALPFSQFKFAACASANSGLLGPRGARFTAVFPTGRVSTVGAENLDLCDYLDLVGIVSPQRLNGFSVTAVFGPLTVNGDTFDGYGITPNWVDPADLTPVSRGGATGSEAVRCEKETSRTGANLNWCQGWLRLSRGRAKWVVSAGGNGASLPRIETFLRSFRPAAPT